MEERALQYPVLKEGEPFCFEGSQVGILVIHGFTGSTQSMRPLGEAYAEKGYTVCGPRLKGHGTHYEDMEQTTYQDWIASVEEGYAWLKERCDTIFVTGLSMGGTLTLYLAEKYPDIKGIIPINAAVDIPNMEEMSNAEEPRFLDAIGSDIKNPGVNELSYERTPLKSVKEILKLMDQVKSGLHRITCPAFIFVSEIDHVVPPLNSQLILEQISSEEKTLQYMADSYHVATLDNDQGMIIEKTLAFVEKQLL
ncbi:alpha/beta hydrolase [Fictibacillus fluitans]|uniref:Alpha/beta fold hydrolase n=1 Tax=Fictibacillus fluitans TaxID=3058422 RepID=A0ABT8I362_9BACL|nr:alpha/beta fold hydrolase [Fictibacillus sp. NE201]MDN4527419.1 alpha/beta fold hydrolase [Fictibacillus sp. NE201]